MKKKILIILIFVFFLTGFYIALRANWLDIGEGQSAKANKYYVLSVLPFVIGGFLLFIYSRQKTN